MLDRTKLSDTIQEAIHVTESELGKMSDEQIELLIKKERGEITTREIVSKLNKKYGVG